MACLFHILYFVSIMEDFTREMMTIRAKVDLVPYFILFKSKGYRQIDCGMVQEARGTFYSAANEGVTYMEKNKSGCSFRLVNVGLLSAKDLSDMKAYCNCIMSCIKKLDTKNRSTIISS